MCGKDARSFTISIVSRGITPACAGKTLTTLQKLVTMGDHPRVCGKDLILLFHYLHELGSPPRVRERPSSRFQAISSAGITPACAGKTFVSFCPATVPRDHPRVCGKDGYYEDKKRAYEGSPPRVRERRAVSANCDLTSGITPACAGKTPFKKFF